MIKKYQETILTYVDILGFKGIIKKYADPADIYDILNNFILPFKSQILDEFSDFLSQDLTIDNYEQNIKELSEESEGIKNYIKHKENLGGRVKIIGFSDLIIRTVSLYKLDSIRKYKIFFNEIEIIEKVIIKLIFKNILIRGAIVIDNCFQTKNIIFGQAIIKGYLLESQESIFPRICIDKKIIYDINDNDNIETIKSKINDIITEDFDGVFFIDYLKYELLNWYDNIKKFDEDEIDIYSIDDLLISHKNFINNELLNPEVKKYENKILWLKNYHNRVLKSFGKKLKEKNKDINDYLI